MVKEHGERNAMHKSRWQVLHEIPWQVNLWITHSLNSGLYYQWYQHLGWEFLRVLMKLPQLTDSRNLPHNLLEISQHNKPKYKRRVKKKSSFSQRLLKQKYLPLKKEHPRQQLSSVNLNPILRTESSRQNCMWSFLPTMTSVAIMLERPTLCFGLGEPS